MSKIKNISGFPELLPEQKLIEDKVISIIRKIYESHGFQPIETPAVELLSTLSTKGVVDKEIYLLRRAKEDSTQSDEGQLALHFDLTVPLARYVAQHFGSLTFPFKRYQLQKVWRGERPQKGRFREFFQFDIDTIAVDELPLACDAEIVSAIGKVFLELALGEFTIRLNSRKILFGAYKELGLSEEQQKQTITVVDKLDKIGVDGVKKELGAAGLASNTIEKIVELTKLRDKLENIEDVLSSPALSSTLCSSGKEELMTFSKLVSKSIIPNIKIDLSLARGLDYYTGLIYEVVFNQFPEFGSVCSGGRYDDLASQFINKKLPGVGVSIGLSRLMELILSKDLMKLESKTKTKVMVAVYSEDQRPKCNEIADELRKYGVTCEVFFKSPKLGKQLDAAASRQIPFVLFINPETGVYEAKDMSSKSQQVISSLKDWAKSLCSSN